MPAATGMAIMGASSLANGFGQASAQKAQGAFAKAQNYQNAEYADDKADQAIDSGERLAGNVRKQTQSLIGQQRNAIAAGNVDVNYGAAQDIQDEAKASGEVDAATAKKNAIMEAWGFKSQAASLRYAGDTAESNANYAASSSVLTGGMQALGYGMQGYGQYKKNNPGTKDSK